jgi:hypothetical protein
VIGGLIYLRSGMEMLFVGPVSSLDAALWAGSVAAIFSTLPLSVLGIFKPRWAAIGLFSSSVIFLYCFIRSSLGPTPFELTVHVVLSFMIRWLALPCTIAALFLLSGFREKTTVVQPARGERK